jgi:hypothetical protein
VLEPWKFTCGNIQADEEGYYWLLNGVERRDRNESLDVLERDLDGISATHLRQMYRKLQKHQGSDWGLSDMVIRAGQEPQVPLDFDLRDLPDLPVTGVCFSFDEGEILLVIECFVEHSSNYNGEADLDVATLIWPLLSRKRLSLVDAEVEQYPDVGRSITVRIGFNPRSRWLSGLYADGLDIKALLEASSGDLTRETVAELIRGGHVAALLGQPEGDWLEAKSQHADLATEVGKIRLAQWVSQFANARDGGVVVLGLATKNRGSGDVITRVTPLPRESGIRRKYVQVLDSKVIPPIEDLRVEVIAHGGDDLLLIEVPPQSEENKPFLVHGAVIEGRAQGTFFSIVRRRNDEMASTHPANVHANLTVGRALLRRGEFPKT